MRITLADTLCLFPVSQQMVGFGTIVSNTIKLIVDVALRIFFKTNMAQHVGYICLGLIRMTPVLGTTVSTIRLLRW